MAAFQFPDPAVNPTVVNPITGSTYQWKEPPGKWTLVAQPKTQVSDIIWEGDSPPTPIDDYKLWYSTDTLELYFYYCDDNETCAWTPTSKPITMLDDLDAQVFDLSVLLNQVNVAASTNENEIQLIKDNLGQVNLQEVLDNGNIADKDIVLTDGVDDLIDISPTEGRIVIASDADLKTPKITLAHFGDHDDGNRKAEIELDENGTRLDFEMSGDVKDVHFRFGDDEKFILNHEGDAEFVGKVIVEPGTSGNEVVTASQLAELNQEIEDIRPSLERGLWNYDSSSTHPSTGNYIGYKLKADSTYCNEQLVACQLAAGDDPTAKAACTREHGDCTADIGNPVLDVGWPDVDFISIHKQDTNEEVHTFADVEIGMYLEVMDIDGGGFGLYQIVEPGIAAGGSITGFYVQHISSEGQQGGSVRVKIFEMASANPADYVRKAGDTMTGQLQIRPEQSKDTGLVVFAGKGSLDNDKTVVFAVTNYKGHEILRVFNHGRIRAGSSAIDYTPEYDSDVVTKKYVDSHGSIPGSPYKLTSKAKKDLSPGEFMKETSNVYHCHPTDMNGVTHYPSTSNTNWTGLWTVFKIYDGTGQKVAAHTCTTVWGQGKDNYIAWKNDTSFINTTLTEGDTYYLADGLFLSY